MSIKPPSISLLPVSPEQLARLQSAIGDFSPNQLAWLSGYFWGMMNQQPKVQSVAPAIPAQETITLISASQTGNARRLAEQLRDDLLAEKLNVNLFNAGDYKFKQIAQEKMLIIVASTQGEGEPAEEAIALYKYLYSKKAPKLSDTEFAVFGLGDTSYEKFCQAGKDFDHRLNELGAQRLLDRVDSDVEYQEAAAQWRKRLTEILKQRIPAQTNTAVTAVQSESVHEVFSTPYTKQAPLIAALATRQKITGRGSDKDVRHIEIDLGDSGLRYQPGDALGVWFKNDPALVDELLNLLWLEGTVQVEANGHKLPLREALISHVELTQNTSLIVEKYAVLAKNEKITVSDCR